jgi:2-phosphoglycerate kinase
MRAFFSKDFMPAIHYSSFEAGASQEDDDEDRVLHGFLAQTRNVLVGVRAAIERVMQEGWSMVLEGVHLVPGMVDVHRGSAIVVQCLVAIEDEDLHRSHFWVRDYATEGLRPLERYIDAMPEIRLIQNALIERAHRFDVPVIMNATLDQAMGEVLDLVLSTAERLARVTA